MSHTATLRRRELNRATLARQLLLERSPVGVLAAVRQLVGLQAQTPQTWYVGLWSRLAAFRPDEVSELLESRELVRAALMRSTIHLVTADDCLALRPLLQPMIQRSTLTAYRGRLGDVDVAAVGTAGRALVESRPMTFGELGRALGPSFPGAGPDALAQSVRATSTLVQVPPRGMWGRRGVARHTTAEAWLGDRAQPSFSVDDLVLRYLSAFGPASVKDVQTWSGLTRLGEVVDRLRGGLVSYRDEVGTEVVDLPDAPRPGGDVEAPVRFLYDFDNLLLSHAERSRVVTEEYRALGAPANGQLPRPVLVDGFVGGLWTVEAPGTTARLTVRPLTRWRAADRAAAEREGRALLAFLHPGTTPEVVVS